MISKDRNILFIVNHRSGSGIQSGLERYIRRRCSEADANYKVHFQYTEGQGHAINLAMAGVQQEFSALVAVGGDGTINEVARGMNNASIPLGIIPKGSGNGLARHLGIPMDTGQAVRSLIESDIVRMDTFTVNNKLSLNVAGIGFDGHVASLFGRNGRRGLLNYVKIILREYPAFREFETNLMFDNNTISRSAFMIAIANSSQYGNNVRIAPDVSVCDGTFNVSVIKKVPLTRLDTFLALFTGNFPHSSYCEGLEADALTIKVAEPIAYHTDGEPHGKDTTFSIRMKPASLSILVPKTRRSGI